ncbi:hypothetical protein [Mycolicibacterium elephantis]|uniref:hypothetical protein n=1 Tax=Mycolicibacterium elephantis TaxID=81858 RepID=UPI0019D4C6D0|nr:hypothetical protein [Mycolicibacterium elephantis]MCV7220098.1 hypothetical protein [Mycolicibacterium elephantis]
MDRGDFDASPLLLKAFSMSSRKSSTYPPKPNRTPDGLSTDEINVAQYNQSLESNAERRCVGTNAKGERCRKFAIAGSTVCRTHGGSTRHVVNKARVRVEMASNRLMGKLIEVAFDDTKPAAVQLDAIKDSLNRAGLKPREQLEVGSIKPYEEVFEGIYSGPRSQRPPDPHGPSDDLHEPSEPVSRDYGELGFTGPADREGHENRSPRPSQRPDRPKRSYVHTEPITGEDAIALANQLRALPPGRSR